MEKKTLHLLILEDSSDDAELAVQELEQEGFIVEWSQVETEKAFREALFPIYDPSGALTNVVVMQEDVTERVRAEEELIRLSNAVRMSTDSIVITLQAGG